MPPLSNIKSIITYFQPNPPDGLVSTGDIWYDPDRRQAFIFADDIWQQIEVTPLTPGHFYGFSIGGQVSSTPVSTTDRILFPFDSGTSTDVGKISDELDFVATCSSSDYGYVIGGRNSSSLSTSYISRMSYPFTSGTSVNKGNLSYSRYAAAAFNSNYTGYTINGRSLSTDYWIIEKFEFPFDIGESLGIGILSAGTRRAVASCQSSRYGYSIGGIAGTSTYKSTIERINFPFVTGQNTLLTSNLTDPRAFVAGCNSTTHGFVVGGEEGDSPIAPVTKIERIQFADDSTSSVTGNLNTSRYSLAVCNSTRFGYAMGGIVNSSGSGTNSVERFEFPFSSGVAVAVGNLNSTRFNNTGLDGTQFWF